MQIEPGKWRMRNGECAVVEFISEANGKYVVFGYTLPSRSIATWTREGKEWSESDSPLDLIEPWTDKPVVNWAAMPAWAKWVAMDSDGIWNWFAKKPDIIPSNCGDWFLLEVVMAGRGPIPVEHAPTFSGNWRDSLVERPAQVGTI